MSQSLATFSAPNRNFPLFVQSQTVLAKPAPEGARYPGILSPHGLIRGAFTIDGYGRAETRQNEVENQVPDDEAIATARAGDMEIQVEGRDSYLMRSADFSAIFTKRVAPEFALPGGRKTDLTAILAAAEPKAAAAEIVAFATRDLRPDAPRGRIAAVSAGANLLAAFAVEGVYSDEDLRVQFASLRERAIVAGLGDGEITPAIDAARLAGVSPWKQFRSQAQARMIPVHENFEVAGTVPDAERPMTLTGARPAIIEKGSMLVKADNGNVFVIENMQPHGWQRATNPNAEPIASVTSSFEEQARAAAKAFRSADPAESAEAKLHMMDLAIDLQKRRAEVDLESTAATSVHFQTAALMSDASAPAVFKDRNEAIARRRDNTLRDFPTVHTLTEWLGERGVNVDFSKIVDMGMNRIYGGGEAVIAHFRKVFGDRTDVPLEDINVYAQPGRHVRPDSALGELIAYAQAGTQIRGPETYNFKNMPGYKSSSDGTYNRDGVDFYIVREPGGIGVYAWPDKASLKALQGAHMGVAPAPKGEVKIYGDDFGFEEILAIADHRPAVAVADNANYKVADLDTIGAQRAAVRLSAPYLVTLQREGARLVEFVAEGDVERGTPDEFKGVAIAMNGQIEGVIVQIGDKVSERVKAAIADHLNPVALPAPAM